MQGEYISFKRFSFKNHYYLSRASLYWFILLKGLLTLREGAKNTLRGGGAHIAAAFGQIWVPKKSGDYNIFAVDWGFRNFL